MKKKKYTCKDMKRKRTYRENQRGNKHLSIDPVLQGMSQNRHDGEMVEIIDLYPPSIIVFYPPREIPGKCVMWGECPYGRECQKYGNPWSPQICQALRRLEEEGIAETGETQNTTT